MSTLVARQPLHPLPMASMQRGPRRLSARLQEKDEPHSNGAHTNGKANSTTLNGTGGKKQQDAVATNNKKRKIDYDEDDDGFAFTRVKKQKPRAPVPQPASTTSTQPLNLPSAPTQTATQTLENGELSEPAKKKRNKMSFSTPKIAEPKPVRRSKRLSDENGLDGGSPRQKTRRKENEQPATAPVPTEKASAPPAHARSLQKTPGPADASMEAPNSGHSATRIALPFADTPVIRRNKAMREGKSGKGERRSSLGLRGRRASSLIETGNSNALPHGEVEVKDFYKHIESESLPEPKRMRQLLTWCATRALSEKPMGTAFEDVSVKQAARIVEEELLKDFANKSEMSDWFAREDMPMTALPLEERPHPKNVQNLAKIKELEEQIRRLRVERDSLETLLRPPVIESMPENPADPDSLSRMDKSLLSASDVALLDSLEGSSRIVRNISTRLNSIGTSLGPTIDVFADGIHKISQYRDTAENVASRALAICAGKLAERERDGRRRALPDEGDKSPRRDLGSVLRGLSQIDR